ncbi:MAG: phosphoribosylanthranilate isomerase [Candidatus Endobugula sp.]
MRHIQSHRPSTRVKICGITSIDDALVAVEAGADAIGLVFYPPSPRYVSITVAAQIAQRVGPFVTVVGLFVNADKVEVNRVLSQVNLHVLQFHGDESAAFCESFQRPYMKVIRMKPELDVEQVINDYSSAVGVLLDAYKKGVPGGTGETFDWKRVPNGENLPAIILAGGLTPDNVASAVTATCPYGVDVSGGVESSPGKKCQNKVISFISNVKKISNVT